MKRNDLVFKKVKKITLELSFYPLPVVRCFHEMNDLTIFAMHLTFNQKNERKKERGKKENKKKYFRF